MGGSTHQVSPDGARNKGIAELNKDKREENKEVKVRDEIMGESQGLSDEDESRINDSAMDMNDGHGKGAVAPLALQAGLQKQQQQQQQQQLLPGPVFLWERILPVRTLKVLLVENDDSTRQVVSALLRNCSYEVTATENGLQAWKILENPANHIDLVLTEVVMPGLSGIGLLSKIMSNDTCKNIPVIMMSSNDSMGTVFKCLSKGAVDFLVKPIRKNELKNLWQHVWRRSHSSSGSVSESGIQTQKFAKSKSADDSDNNSSSNDQDDNASIGLNARDGSDHGSVTQSYWMQHAVEVESPQPMSPSDQLADPHDSTCAHVISDTEIYCNKWVSMTATRECQEQEKHADEFMGKDLKIGVPRNPDIHPEAYPTENTSTKLIGMSEDKQPENEQKNEDMQGLESSNAFNESSSEAANLIGGIAGNRDAQLLNHVSDSKDNINDNSVEPPSLHLSLKKLRSTGEGGSASHEERNVLRRSDQSAFSRYRTSAVSTQAPTGYVGSCSPIDNSSEAVKTESTHNVISNSNPATLKQGSNGSSDDNDKGSTTKNVYTNSPMAANSNHPSAFHLVQRRTSQQPVHEKIDNRSDGTQIEYQVQHHHHHYHHHHHHVQQLQQKPSNACVEPVEGNAANYSQNGSNSGSNHGSNGQNVNTGVNMETVGIVEKCGVGCGNGSGCGSGSGVDQNRLTQEGSSPQQVQAKKEREELWKEGSLPKPKTTGRATATSTRPIRASKHSTGKQQ